MQFLERDSVSSDGLQVIENFFCRKKAIHPFIIEPTSADSLSPRTNAFICDRVSRFIEEKGRRRDLNPKVFVQSTTKAETKRKMMEVDLWWITKLFKCSLPANFQTRWCARPAGETEPPVFGETPRQKNGLFPFRMHTATAVD